MIARVVSATRGFHREFHGCLYILALRLLAILRCPRSRLALFSHSPKLLQNFLGRFLWTE